VDVSAAPDISFCPYAGLDSYRADLRDYFFGREDDVGVIVSNVFTANLTVLYGPSAVGKSSVLNAGLVPALRENGALVITWREWREEDVLKHIKALVIAQVPQTEKLTGAERLDELLALASTLTGRRVVIIFDQFEEYFVYHPDHDVSTGSLGDRFDGELARCVNREDLDVGFLIALRDDALSGLDRYQVRIPNILSQSLRLSHLTPDSARRAIRGPIDKFNELRLGPGRQAERVTIQDALVEEIVEQVRSGRISLSQLAGKGLAATAPENPNIETAFLQLVMTRLWKEMIARRGHDLTQKMLGELGGVESIVNNHLDDVVNSLASDEQRDLCAAIFDRMVTPSGTKVACRFSDLKDWAESDEKTIQDVLDQLRDERVVREIASRDGRREARQYEMFHDVLCPAALDWRARHTQVKEAARLRELAEQQQKEAVIEGARLRELAKQQRKTALFQQRAYIGLIALSVIAVFLTLWGINTSRELRQNRTVQEDLLELNKKSLADASEQRRLAHESEDRTYVALADAQIATQAKEAQEALVKTVSKQKELLAQESSLNRSRELTAVAKSRLSSDPELSALLAIHALRSYPRPITEGIEVLHDAAVSMRPHRAITLPAEYGDGMAAANGAFAVGIVGKSVVMRDIEGSRDVGRIAESTLLDVEDAMMSADGRRMLIYGSREVTVFDTARFPDDPAVFRPAETVKRATISPDGRYVAALADQTVHVWDLDEGRKMLASFPVPGSDGPADAADGEVDATAALVFSADGQRLAIARGPIVVVDWRNKSVQARVTIPAREEAPLHLALNPIGELTVVYAGGEIVRWPAQPTKGKVRATKHTIIEMTDVVALNSSGTQVAVARKDLGIEVRTLFSSGSRSVILFGHRREISSLGFALDGRLMSIDASGSLKLWNLRARGEMRETDDVPVGVVAVNAGATRIAAKSGQHVQMFDWAAGEWKRGPSIAFEDATELLAVGGHHIASMRADGSILLLDTRDERARTVANFAPYSGKSGDEPAPTLKAGPARPRADSRHMLFLSDDGRRIVALNHEGRLLEWAADAGARESEIPLKERTVIRHLRVAQDGRTLLAVSGGDLAEAVVFVPETGEVKRQLSGKQVSASAISADGRLFAIARGSRLEVLEAVPESKALVLEVDRGAISNLAFAPGAKSLAIGFAAGGIAIANLATREIVYLRMAGDAKELTFSKDGAHIVTVTRDGRLARYYVDHVELSEVLMRRISRQLTDEECKEHFHVANCRALPKYIPRAPQKPPSRNVAER
jgi:WD40 repeat protein